MMRANIDMRKTSNVYMTKISPHIKRDLHSRRPPFPSLCATCRRATCQRGGVSIDDAAQRYARQNRARYSTFPFFAPGVSLSTPSTKRYPMPHANATTRSIASARAV